MKIAMIAGETSGDLLGAGLIRALRHRYPNARFVGIGGERMIAEGMDSWFPMEQLSIMGLFEVLRHLPELFRLRDELLARFLGDPPDVFIGIDAPDFNLRIERVMHQRGVPTVHYVSPSVWAWRQGRIHGIRKSVDLMLTLLPFEAAFYEQHQQPVCFVGHPMADQIPEHSDPQVARQRLGLPSDAAGPIIALLPGSRRGEIERLLEIQLRAAEQFQSKYRTACFLIPAASAPRFQQIQTLLAEFPGLAVQVYSGRARECMEAADAVVLASGTATLECMLVKRPMVVVYRLATLSYWLMRLLIRIPYVSLPNLLAGRGLVPELIQRDLTPDRIVEELERCLQPNALQALQQDFLRIHRELARSADERAADAVSGLLERRRTANEQAI